MASDVVLDSSLLCATWESYKILENRTPSKRCLEAQQRVRQRSTPTAANGGTERLRAAVQDLPWLPSEEADVHELPKLKKKAARKATPQKTSAKKPPGRRPRSA